MEFNPNQTYSARRRKYTTLIYIRYASAETYTGSESGDCSDGYHAV